MTMGEIQAVLESRNKVTIFLTVIAAFVAIQFLIKLIDFFTTRFGIETKTSLEKKKVYEEMERIKTETDSLRDTQKKVVETQELLLDKINKIDERETMNEIERKRWVILDFANAIRKRDYDREAYNHVLNTYEEYERILKAKKLANGEADLAIAYIRKRYAEYIENGFPEY